MACSSSNTPLLGVHQLTFSRKAADISACVEAVVKDYEGRLESLLKTDSQLIGRQLFDATFGSLANADGHAALVSAELTVPALVSGDAEARAASSAAKKRLQNMWARAYMRPDLYARLAAAQDTAETPEEHRLTQVMLQKFRHAGAHLENAVVRGEVAELDAMCASLAFEIEQNINEDCSHVVLSEEELEGCAPEFIKSLPKAEGDANGRQCSVKAPVSLPIMRRAASGETRRKMQESSQRQCMDKNGPLLSELIQKRHEAACKMGFASHAERMLGSKMAGAVKTARGFCEDMLGRLAQLQDAELGRLTARKRIDLEQPQKRRRTEESSPELKSWDLAFYTDLLKREELSLDDEQLKEFFPLEGTIERLLAIYSELLGLAFVKTSSLPVWHEDVVTFEVRRGEDLVGHLYLDQFPRDGKFGHQMIIPLAPSFVDSSNGRRCIPACANISNLPRPQGDKPALLRFAEMRTLFHELGHAMHCLCTTTKFSLLSWAWPMVPWPGGVEQDFLELPSMALEKFASEPSLLRRVARHYSGKEGPEAPTLGEDTIESIQSLDKFMVGTSQSRYFAMALFDLLVHAQAPPYSFGAACSLSIEELHRRCLEEHARLQQLSGTHPCASWYHLVIGYDAGYYGYGWSDVYAADVFESMLQAEEGPLSAETGAKLRDEILGPCATRTGGDMLRAFLGREPTADAWCRRNGVPM
mmetsp:Transcript_33650/g.96637  ORF Transcript_33650/g.96637 Transcript_33650/m.96637 type:complete len:701 (-) Transcript_33650:163-2265(-)